MKKPSYYEELIKIREFISKQKVNPRYIFPVNHCDHASWLAGKILGLDIVYGTYDGHEHTLNADPKINKYIDLTRTQFNLSIPEIVLEKQEESIFIENNKQTQKRIHKLMEKEIGKSLEDLMQTYISKE